MDKLNIYTIGFTQKSAEKFFRLIKNENIKILIDTRLNTSSQLAGFAKKEDLKYFLKEICHVNYSYHQELAPTKTILDAYKKNKGSWEIYEKEFMELMYKRNIEKIFTEEMMNDACLLCSEDKPHYCHRRLVAEYLDNHWKVKINLKHLY